MTGQQKKWLVRALVILVLGGLGVAVWYTFLRHGKDDGLISGNGRIEAVEIDVAPKIAGRVKEILVREGEFVTAGQVVARMDTDTLEAQLREAVAQRQQAQSSVVTAQSQLAQRESERSAALALLAQREADLDKARKHARRSSELVVKGAIAQQDADDDRAQLRSAEAAVNAVRAQIAASEATIITARSQTRPGHGRLLAQQRLILNEFRLISRIVPSKPPATDGCSTRWRSRARWSLPVAGC